MGWFGKRRRVAATREATREAFSGPPTPEHRAAAEAVASVTFAARGYDPYQVLAYLASLFEHDGQALPPQLGFDIVRHGLDRREVDALLTRLHTERTR